MKNIRLIARLDVKGKKLIKGVHLEGLRVIGDPEVYAKKYYDHGADEIIYMDIVASLYGRSNLVEIVRKTAANVFVPMTVGGGVRSVEDVGALLRAGADKVAVNTAAVQQPDLLSEISGTYGSQCTVLSIEAKKRSDAGWEVYTDCGREASGRDAVEWARRAVELGAGEVLLTSIDREGTRKGFDTELVHSIANAVPVPVIASGGYGLPNHLSKVLTSGADAVAFADCLHFDRTDITTLRDLARSEGWRVRNV